MPNVEYGTNKKIEKKEVSYIGRDFGSLRNNLIEFSKTYFPAAYNDFNESSPGMLFIEMAAYVGDVLSFYIDKQFQETLLHSAQEKKNIFKIAQSFGYKPKLSSPAVAVCQFSVEVPALASGTTFVPDTNYAPILTANSKVASETGIEFRVLDDVNFKVSTALDSRKDTISQYDGTTPTHFRLEKNALVESGTKVSETFTFGAAKKFDKVFLTNENVVHIESVIDDDGNTWYEVPFLAQDTVFESVENNETNTPDSSDEKSETPFLLKLIKSARRFTTYVRSDGKTEVRFGAGISSNADEEIIPNPDNVGSSLGTGLSKLDTSFDPSNFMKTKAFGLAPSNITLTITYHYGGSVEDNVMSNSITNLDSINLSLSEDGLDSSKAADARASLQVTNKDAATGGSSGESNEEVRQNALAYFNTQNRAVTKEDYITRVYSLPQKYGKIAKCFIVQDEQLETKSQLTIVNKKKKKKKTPNVIPNPMALNFYVLGFDDTRRLTTLNDTSKQNLKLYLSQYRILTDAINIKDAYIINFGIKFAIITQRGYNKNVVLAKCIESLKKHYDIKRWQINQPLILSDAAYIISLVDGVASVVPPEEDNPNKQLVLVENKFKVESGYSGNVYDMQSATKEGIVYPSLDPSIFELKYPDIDIQGKVVGDI